MKVYTMYHGTIKNLVVLLIKVKYFLPKFCMMLPRVFMFACEKVKHVLTSRPKFDRVPLYTG